MNTPYPPVCDPEKEAAEQRWLDWMEEISWPPDDADDVQMEGGDWEDEDPPEWPL